MERKLRFLEKEVKKDGIPMLDTGDNPDAPAPREMTDLEAEHHHPQAMHDPSMSDETMGLLGEETHRVGQPLRLGFVAGVILRERIPAFERMLWRACRGNVFLRQAEIETPLEDPVTGDQVYKSVFIIFFQGDQLKTRVKKICEGFRATLYPCPETQAERREMAIGVMTRIEDLNTVLAQTQDHRHRVLVAAAKNVKVWFIKVRKIKAIYHTLNMFNLDVTQKCLIAECWCPVADLDRIQQALRRGTERSGSSVPSILNRMSTKQVPPTYNRTNKFTQGFQNIVDAYGVASYREVNPAIFTVITFPFLFAVMFGDMGHGAIMFFFALYIVLKEKQLSARRIDDEIFKTFFEGRYIILLMGAFSIYTGFIYNDIFSKSLNIFGSSWYAPTEPFSVPTLKKFEKLQLGPNGSYTGTPYPIGLDPVWQLALNKIAFTNSLKMKLSVIMGVSQMFFGIALSFLNHRYFQKPLNIICEFIPSLIFLFCMFGYMVLRIFYKWVNYDFTQSQSAPSLLIGAINMFLFNYAEEEDPVKYHITSALKGFQCFLVVVAALCVPWMMLVKPFYLRHLSRFGQFKHQPLSVQSGDLLNHDHDQEVVHNHDMGGLHQPQEEEEEPFDFSEVFVHQVIHTIEFCLGCISHTASYLRLWALSLAHAQLSEVLWSMVLRIGFSSQNLGGAFMLVFVFMFWACLTVAVLVLMEGLSAFLHALRLHWVEFQSKFYAGTGYKFQPFCFDSILDHGEE
nr:hypothetical protein BaRGS_026616 [Batillaria attramentaria]